jgi:hypothetical protein
MKMKLFLTAVGLSLFLFSCQKDELNKVPVADAGSSQVTQLPIDSITLVGKGSDADGRIVAYLWSKVSGPGNPAIMNPGSASTIVKGLTAGLFLFQLMVTDNEGATGVDTVSVQVTPSQTQTLSLQPDRNPNEVHIWGNNSGLEGSAPGQNEIGATSWTYNGATVGQRGLVKFDLNQIPSNATILSAKLTLYSNPSPNNGDLVHANAGPDNTTLIQRVTASWTPSLVKWTNQPASTTQNQVVVPHTNSPFLDLFDLDVTSVVQSMVNTNTNYGFLVRLQTEVPYNSRIFCSSFYPDAGKHPKLVIQYK